MQFAMRRVRLWQIMLAVLIAAVAFAMTVEWPRRAELYTKRAMNHEQRVNNDWARASSEYDYAYDWRQLRENTWHRSLAEKWRNAAKFPFWPVEPDPSKEEKEQYLDTEQIKKIESPQGGWPGFPKAEIQWPFFGRRSLS